MKKNYLIILFIALVGCRFDEYKPQTGEHLQKKDLKTLSERKMEETPIYIPPPKPKGDLIPNIFFKKASLHLTEKVDIKDMLVVLLQKNGINVQIDPTISHKNVFHATDMPLIDIIEQIATMADLRYTIRANFISFEHNTPFLKNYNVQFLNLSRQTENRISIATDVFSSSPKQVLDNGSNSSVKVTSQNDFWKELESNLKMILSNNDGKKSTQINYSLNKQAGMISVSGNNQQQRFIESYLNQLRRSVSSQVLIEAKIIEVSLKDQYHSGINWAKLNQGFFVNDNLGSLSQKGVNQFASNAQGAVMAIGTKGRNFSAIIQALQEFGSSRTLSSPRLTVMNNQTAILKVAQNQVYFRLNYDRQYSTMVNRESVNVSSDIQTVPIGLVMFVQPSIDLDTGSIVLSVRPTISRMTQTVSDPAVNIAYNANIAQGAPVDAIPPQSLIPVVEVREIDSVLRLKPGEIGALGGLMEIRSNEDRGGIPILQDLHFFGELFKSTSENEEIVELVILLKASLLEDDQPIEEADRKLYHLQNDPRAIMSSTQTN
jgi:MSHA type pilus biogenesis protein MshL